MVLLLIGHGHLRAHLKKLGLINYKECGYGKEGIETPSDMLYECPMFMVLSRFGLLMPKYYCYCGSKILGYKLRR